jgi:hypothetical protein
VTFTASPATPGSPVTVYISKILYKDVEVTDVGGRVVVTINDAEYLAEYIRETE